MAKYTKAQEAYIEGVEETASNLEGVIYINPDLLAPILEKHGIDYHGAKTTKDLEQAIADAFAGKTLKEVTEFIDEMCKVIHKSMEEQIPGSGDAYFGENPTLELKATEVSNILFKGTYSVDNMEINGKYYGYANLPAPQDDTKEEFFRSSLSDNYPPAIVDAIIKNMPGDDMAYMRWTGRHEGGHLDNQRNDESTQGIIAEERKADAVANNAGGDAEFSRAIRSWRALNTDDIDHATSAPLLSGDQVTKVHAEVAGMFDTVAFDFVSFNFDFEKHKGKATTAKELLQEDPDAFFDTLNEQTKIKSDSAAAELEKNPDSYVAQRTAYQAQVFANYARAFEDGYRRYALGEETPEPSPAQVIPENKEAEVLEKINDEDAIDYITEQHRAIAAINYDPIYSYDWANSGAKTQDIDFLPPEDLKKYLDWEKGYLKDLQKEAEALYKNQPHTHENLDRVISIEQAIDHYSDRHNNYAIYLNETSDIETKLLSLPKITDMDTRFEFYFQELENSRGVPLLSPDQIDPETGKEITEPEMQPTEPERQPLEISPEEIEQYVEELVRKAQEEIFREAGLEMPAEMKEAEPEMLPETTEPPPIPPPGTLDPQNGDPLLDTDDSILEIYATAEIAVMPLSSVTADFENKTMMVGDTPMTEFFAQNANPQTPDQTVELDPATIAQTHPDNTITSAPERA